MQYSSVTGCIHCPLAYNKNIINQGIVTAGSEEGCQPKCRLRASQRSPLCRAKPLKDNGRAESLLMLRDALYWGKRVDDAGTIILPIRDTAIIHLDR